MSIKSSLTVAAIIKTLLPFKYFDDSMPFIGSGNPGMSPKEYGIYLQARRARRKTKRKKIIKR
ncbi:MAG: hypothetical protein IJV46_06920 [Acidaminococcaceae bacterium]|nr:hypothetical protein [Acidaminococcaceae bacterium]